ncbi:alpha/beta hydrolase [Luteolibacter sp. LG18]|uniref:alpha/beta hydrolase n=1 Tax=Luteolibacter sp. LG18 TaxID=2819286 RepID=UPI0030C6E702
MIRSLLLLVGFLSLASGEPAVSPGLHADIEYRNVDGESLCLDASVPLGDGPFPAAILIHGGGWGSGDKAQDFGALAKPLNEAGIAWFSINYRLAPRHPWPAGFEDVQAAIRWVKANAAAYRIDPRRLALVGYSAGGQLATLAAIRADESLRVQAVVGLAPAVDLVADSRRRGEVSVALRNLLGLPPELDDAALAKIAAISPAEEVKAGMPPFLIVQGTADKSVRHEDAVAFVKRLEGVKVPCVFSEMRGAPHRIADWEKFAPDYPATVAGWLKATLKETPAAK